MTHTRRNVGVCSQSTTVQLADNGTIEAVQVRGGCNGNLQGICALLQGMSAQDAIARMQNLSCNGGPTSCPAQIALCLQEALEQL